METIIRFFTNSAEVRNFGFNMITVSVILTVILSSYQMWGVTQQIKTIKRRRSTESIFAPLFIFGFFYLVTTIFYGLYSSKLAITYNGFNAFFFLALLITIGRWGKINRLDILAVILFSSMIPVMVFIPDKKTAYMSCSSVMLLGLLAQLILLAIRKKRGSLEPKLMRVYIVTNSSWLIYGILMDNWPLKLSNSIGLTLIVPIVILLRKYKDS